MTTLNQQVLIRRVQQCLASANAPEAKSICEHLLAQDKKNPDLLFLLAEACNDLAQYDQCIAHLRRCVAIKPRSAK